jgi:peptidoglycan/xylan/chitin deacetylase (PgdA/CDA1 family)
VTDSHTRIGEEKVSGVSIPILTYHHLDTPGTRWSVSTAQLNAQLEWLKDHGYTPITMSRLLDAIIGTGDLPTQAVVITNDDGHPESLRFAEILERHGVFATYFLPTDMQLSTDQIRILDQHGEVGGHTVTHAELSRLSTGGQRAQIATNKHFLESVVGHPIRCFAYPYGVFTSDTVRIVREISYDGAVLAGRVKYPNPTVDPYQIPRIKVLGTQKLPEFVACVRDDSQCSVLRG